MGYDKSASITYDLTPSTVTPDQSPTPAPATSTRGGHGPGGTTFVGWLAQSMSMTVGAMGALLFVLLAAGAGLWWRHRVAGRRLRADRNLSV